MRDITRSIRSIRSTRSIRSAGGARFAAIALIPSLLGMGPAAHAGDEAHFRSTAKCLSGFLDRDSRAASPGELAGELEKRIRERKDLYRILLAEKRRVGGGGFFLDQEVSRLRPDEIRYFRKRAGFSAHAEDKLVTRWYSNVLALGLENLRWEIAKSYARLWLAKLEPDPDPAHVRAVASFLYGTWNPGIPELQSLRPASNGGVVDPATALRDPPEPSHEQLRALTRSGKGLALDEPTFSQGCCRRWSSARQASELCGLKCPLPAGITKIDRLTRPDDGEPAEDPEIPQNSLPVWIISRPPGYPMPGTR